MSEKVIFLDIDGVVVTSRSHCAFAEKSGGIMRDPDPVILNVLKKVGLLGVKIVISSTWRYVAEKELREMLTEYGVIEFLHEDWCTPLPEKKSVIYVPAGSRGQEIQAWLDKHSEVKRYLILDDDIDMLPDQLPNFIRSDSDDGLNRLQLLRILNFASDPYFGKFYKAEKLWENLAKEKDKKKDTN